MPRDPKRYALEVAQDGVWVPDGYHSAQGKAIKAGEPLERRGERIRVIDRGTNYPTTTVQAWCPECENSSMVSTRHATCPHCGGGVRGLDFAKLAPPHRRV